MATTREYTWEDLENAVGQDFSDGEIHWGIEPVERTSIRRYCEVIESDFPFFYSDEEARKHGYKSIICPASHIQNHMGQGLWKPGDPTRWPLSERNYWANGVAQARQLPLPQPPTTAAFATEREVEYFRPVHVGDHLGARGRKLLSVNVRETSVGFGAFSVFETVGLGSPPSRLFYYSLDANTGGRVRNHLVF